VKRPVSMTPVARIALILFTVFFSLPLAAIYARNRSKHNAGVVFVTGK
jgi:hypothetical protein